ncbi:MAG TPA: DNA cytosine methyltransferase [Methanobacteriales archaeon]|jgi:Site-specific DNA methylase|nr:(cytosine-5)-methyltransferase 1 [Methanobacteriaceae archaeon]HIH61641.1 DNA cytosine methyltransferase [Methanobacteriales archaeon]
MGFYRRLSWFEPSPTLVTSPAMKGRIIVHPWEDRPLSINEYKLIQGFLLVDWLVPGSVTDKYRKIGEAVPPTLSYAIANKVREILGSEE